MKTFETEKNNIPEGATHYSEECVGKYFCWYAVTEDDAKICVLDGKGFGYKWYKCTNEHYGCDVKPIPKSEVVEWKNGDRVVIKNSEGFCVWDEARQYLETEGVVMAVFENTNGKMVATVSHDDGMCICWMLSMLSKPESPEEKEQRERLEASYDLYCYAKKESVYSCVIVSFKEFIGDFSAREREEYLAIVDKTNYRKGE